MSNLNLCICSLAGITPGMTVVVTHSAPTPSLCSAVVEMGLKSGSMDLLKAHSGILYRVASMQAFCVYNW